MKNKNKIKLAFFLLTIMFILIGVGIGFMINYQNSCESNPLVFGVERLEKLNDVNFSCFCYSTDHSLKPFYFDDEGLYKENPNPLKVDIAPTESKTLPINTTGSSVRIRVI